MMGEWRKGVGGKRMPNFEGRGNQCQHSLYSTVRCEDVEIGTCLENHLSGMPGLLKTR
jgi:hypothetical protein